MQQRTVSDPAGRWSFAKVPPGAYDVRVSMAGFTSLVMAVTVGDHDVTGVRMPLRVGTGEDRAAPPVREMLRDASAIPHVSPPAPPSPLPAPALPATQGIGGGVGAGAGRGAGMGSQATFLRADTVETASYAAIEENRFRSVADHPLSTFSSDVDTASYTNVRRFLNEGRLPPADAVRVEEMINYFKYDYAAPRGDAPVAVTTEVAVCPWNDQTRLALIGVQASPLRQEKTPPRNLTFLLDVSGSMMPANRLPLVKAAMLMLVDSLRDEDKVSVVVYAGASGVALKPTSGSHKTEIRRTIENLQAGGSTNGAAGIQLAYDLAAENFVDGGVNRVILATDGDFNVGVTSHADLLRLIERKRETGVYLSVLGVGDNNLMDSTMEMLADKGNGNYAYLDSVQEARRVLIKEAGATFVTVAKDVKLQVEFNPRFVAAYRLVGYENRLLKKEDFNNDRKDAGEMGAGHTVTALYEIVPAGTKIPGADVDPLKYQRQETAPAAASNTSELMTVKVRYKTPQATAGAADAPSRLLEFPVQQGTPRMTGNIGFASAVAAFGMLLRNSEFKGSATYGGVLAQAREHRGADPEGYRAELARLIDLAAALQPHKPKTEPDSRR